MKKNKSKRAKRHLPLAKDLATFVSNLTKVIFTVPLAKWAGVNTTANDYGGLSVSSAGCLVQRAIGGTQKEFDRLGAEKECSLLDSDDFKKALPFLTKGEINALVTASDSVDITKAVKTLGKIVTRGFESGELNFDNQRVIHQIEDVRQ